MRWTTLLFLLLIALLLPVAGFASQMNASGYDDPSLFSYIGTNHSFRYF